MVISAPLAALIAEIAGVTEMFIGSCAFQVMGGSLRHSPEELALPVGFASQRSRSCAFGIGEAPSR